MSVIALKSQKSVGAIASKLTVTLNSTYYYECVLFLDDLWKYVDYLTNVPFKPRFEKFMRVRVILWTTEWSYYSQKQNKMKMTDLNSIYNLKWTLPCKLLRRDSFVLFFGLGSKALFLCHSLWAACSIGPSLPMCRHRIQANFHIAKLRCKQG